MRERIRGGRLWAAGLAGVAAMALTMLSDAASPLSASEFPEPADTERSTATPLAPDEVVANAKLPPGFRLEVFAAEPDVRNPIAIATDGRGRLWVAENYTWAGNGLGTWDDTLRDRIVVFADHDGDGRPDERTVFWDGGTRLTSVAVGLGGVWVIDLPQVLFIPDRDDDLVPDGPPEVVLDGLDETSVGHTPANGLTWGPDGWLWGRHGIQGTSTIGPPGSADSQRIQINTGLWRYHPGRRLVEKVLDGMTNSWGTDFDAHGESFVINTVIGHLWHAVHGSHVERMYGVDLEPYVYELMPQVADHVHWDTGEAWSDVRDGVSDRTSAAGGGHAHIGLMIYQGSRWPEAYRGGVFTLNLHGRRINHDHLAPSGVGFTASHGDDLCFIADPFFRGMDLIAAPDGSVFIADWSDTGECHDHDGVHRSSGRIYRLTYGDASPTRPPHLAADGSSALRQHLFANDQWWSRAAVREWQARSLRGEDLADDVAWLRTQAAGTHDPLHRLRALWALAAIDGGRPENGGDRPLDESLLLARLGDDNAFVRSWAMRLLVDGCRRGGLQPSAAAVAALVGAAADDHAAPVQLHLASAVGRLDDDAAWQLAEAIASHDTFAADPRLGQLVWFGLAATVDRHAIRAASLAAVAQLPSLRRSLARRLAGLVETEPEAAGRLLEAAIKADEPTRADLVTGFADGLRGWRQAEAPPGYASLSTRLAARSDEATRSHLRELDLVFGEGRGLTEVRAIALDGSAPAEARREAIAALAASMPADGAAMLQGLLGDRGVIAAALAGLARYDDPATPGIAIAHLGIFTPADRKALIDLLASRPAYASSLLDAVEAGQIAREEISAFHARQIADLDDASLTARLSSVWGEVRPSDAARRELIERLRRELTPERLATADTMHGRGLFARDCASCHVLFGTGRSLGPDLTGSNRTNLDYLLENIVDPGASVGEGFRAVTFLLEDGRSLTGVIGGSDDRTLTIHTAAESLTLDRRDIAAQAVQAVSLMPDGMLARYGDDDIRDLVAYLMSPRQVPLPAGVP
jgi:putative membrane-bound dehydrogenase-like protein